ncbi:MAG: hypothetical protein M1837_003656 [Sclerophora amabilis]|nr:MAG: hypothetical protein M1837_003656 [Sclerophora amabilis]
MLQRQSGRMRSDFNAVDIAWSLWTMLMLARSGSSQAVTFSLSNELTSNATSMDPDHALYLKTSQRDMVLGVQIDPVPLSVGSDLTPEQLEQLQLNGTLILIDTQNYPDVRETEIAYLSCDNASYTDGNINASSIFSAVASHNPAAIVLYSTRSDRCEPNATSDYDKVYTMLDKTNSTNIEAELRSTDVANSTEAIISQGRNVPASSGTNNSSRNDREDGQAFDQSPTTAVAMIILYSITGVITALFLIIIVTGAIRAHRHPERYGPRQGVLGRTRQSRARGIARAMLETIPIVKFGDNEQDKRPATDVELGTSDGQREPGTGAVAGEAASSDTQRPSDERRREGDLGADTPGPNDATRGPSTETSPSAGEDAVTTAPKAKDKALPKDPSKDEGLGCSICTEDFVKGEDIRVLPCDHKYHPDCVDPWLLNVSGTCPLCRIDLRPQTSEASPVESSNTTESTPEHPGNLPPPLLAQATATAEARGRPGGAGAGETENSDPRRSRRTSWLATQHLGLSNQSRPEERIAALRRLREQTREGQDGDRRRSRLSGLFSSLHIRTRRADVQDGSGDGGSRQRSEAAGPSRNVSATTEEVEAARLARSRRGTYAE